MVPPVKRLIARYDVGLPPRSLRRRQDPGPCNNRAAAKISPSTVGAAFLDIKVTFNNVQQDAVTTALSASGHRGRTSRWICSYLIERRIFVPTHDGDTKCHLVTKGVPQGGALSPTLINIVPIGIADELYDNIQASLYADEISV